MDEEQNDFSAELIGQTIPTIEGTLPRPSSADVCATCGNGGGEQIFTDGKVWWHNYCDRPRPNWMNDKEHAGRKVVIASFPRWIRDLRVSATKARHAYQQDHMRIPCEYYAEACDDAADLLQARLNAVLGSGNQDTQAKRSDSTSRSEAP